MYSCAHAAALLVSRFLAVAAVACSVACSVARTLYKVTWLLNGMCSHMLVFEVTALSLSSKAVLVVRHGPVFIYKLISSNLI
jgi:hypothetical protein